MEAAEEVAIVSMGGYEPACGFNLPPGCFEGDPRAPWNAPEPWVGRTCGECRHCAECGLTGGGTIRVCICDTSWIIEVDPKRPAEECFEE